MLTRVCAGGVVFQEDRVFILKNDKGEWILPKGVVRSRWNDKGCDPAPGQEPAIYAI